MAVEELKFTWRDGSLTKVSVAEVSSGKPNNGLPVVVLLHGTSGTINDMRDPGAMDSPFNYEMVPDWTRRDRGWHAYPNVGFWSLGLDPLAPVTGWEPTLIDFGYPTVNYSQVDPKGRLVRTVAQLRGLLQALEEHQPFKGRNLILVGHSRGGVLARQVLVDLARDADAGSSDARTVLSRIKRLVTLHAPNQGSTLANLAIGVNRQAMRARLGSLPAGTLPRSMENSWLGAIDGLLTTIQEETGSPAYHDYAFGSPVLAALAAAEPVPGIEYFTFGGTSPLLMRLGGWAFTPLSAVPVPNWPPFHWETIYTSLLALPPVLPMAPPELTYGVGDILVAAPMAHLPFSTRFNNPLNHAQVLWNKGVKTQVMAILRGEMVHQSAPVELKLPKKLVITSIRPDSTDDPDRTIDAYFGQLADGRPWELTAVQARVLMQRGHRFFTQAPDGELVPVHSVMWHTSKRVYLRTVPEYSGPGKRLSDQPHR